MALGSEPTYIGGAQGTGNINQTQRMVDIPDEIFYLEEDLTPLVFMARGKNLGKKKIKQKSVINPEYKVLEKVPHGNWVSLANAIVTATTVLTLSQTPTMMKVGYVLKIIGGDNIRITAYSTTAKTISVTRAFGGTAAGSHDTNTPLAILFPISMEGDTMSERKQVQPAARTNYCGIIRHPFGATNTLIASSLYGGDAMDDSDKEAWIETRKEWERMLIHGEPYEDSTSYTHPIRVSGGVVYWIKQGTSTHQQSTEFNTTTLATFVRNLFRYGSRTKVLLCGSQTIDAFDALKAGKLQMKPNEDIYNIKAMQYETGHGTCLLVRDLELENSPYGSTTVGFGGMIIGLDIDDISLRHLKGRDMKLNTGPTGNGIQANDADEVTYEYKGEIGLMINSPNKHRVWDGITGWSI